MARTLPHRHYELQVKAKGVREPWAHVIYIEDATRREAEDEMKNYRDLNRSDLFRLVVVADAPSRREKHG